MAAMNTIDRIKAIITRSVGKRLTYAELIK